MHRHQAETLARTFRDYIAVCREANWFIRQPGSSHPTVDLPRLPKNHTDLKTLPQPQASTFLAPVDTPVETFTEKEEEDLRQLVSKGSNFHRKAVQAYLKPLGYQPFKRSQASKRDQYPTEKAKHTYLVSKSLESSKYKSTILHHLNNNSVSDIIALLVELTPKPISRDKPSPITTKDAGYHHRKLKKHVYSEIPPLPSFDNDPLKFEEYVYHLTHSTFHYKNSSKFDGIIPKLLRNMFHPLNTTTMKLRSTNSFNYLLHFFGSKFDIATCRELLVQMGIEGVRHNTTTYNIMLRNLTYVQSVQHLSDPLKVALKLLKQMKSNNLKADLVTWNTVFQLLPDERGKIMLTHKRTELNIPADDHYLQSILQYLIETRNATTSQLLVYTKDLKIPLNRKPSRTIIHRLIHEKQFDSAYKLMIKLNSQNNAMKPGIDDLNAFLIAFADIKRVDLVQGMIQTFGTKWGVKPNYDSYNQLMRALSISGNWKEKYSILRVLYHQMLNDLDDIIAGEFWLRRLRSRLKFVYDIDVQLSPELTESELELKKAVECLVFDERVPVWVKGKGNKFSAEVKKAIRILGYYQSRHSAPRKDETPAVKAKKEKAAGYRQKIGTIGIELAMKKRTSYAEDHFTGLKKELLMRGIIE